MYTIKVGMKLENGKTATYTHAILWDKLYRIQQTAEFKEIKADLYRAILSDNHEVLQEIGKDLDALDMFYNHM